MTSSTNYQETFLYFQSHEFFGRQIDFFTQSNLPLLDLHRRPFGPEAADGNGSLYHTFWKSPIAKKWQEQGIESVSVLPVDNILADPFHPPFVSLHETLSADITIRCVERLPSEKMGVLIERHGRVEIIEYCDCEEKIFEGVDHNGRLIHPYGYAGLVLLRLDFMQKASHVQLPLHWVQKTMIYQGHRISFWKGEKFLFDAFPKASSIAVLCSARETCYAPLKEKTGRYGIEAVEKLCQ